MQPPRVHSLAGVPSVMFIAIMTTLVQSFVVIKVAFVGLFVFFALVDGALRHDLRVYPRLIYFYLVIGIAGLVWSLIGLLNPESFLLGVTDSLRLYAVWSAAFLFLYTLLRSSSSLQYIHNALVAAGILISLMNFAGILDQVAQLGIFPEFVSKELNQKASFYEGYIQITSRNIGSLFFLVPYLIAVQIRSDAKEVKSFATKLSLVLCLILSVISGRRALLLIIAVTPLTLVVVSALSGNLRLMKSKARKVFVGYAVFLVLGFGVVASQPDFLMDQLFVQHLEDAFSATDERAIQKPFLLDGFKTSPVIGTGFGYAARYQRNDERPWIYELTYYQMLMNAGVLGVALIASLLLTYGIFILSIFRRFKPGSVIPFGLLVGVISLLLGASSNPYLGSFDLLFFVGFLPFIATYRRGFEAAAVGR